MSCDILKIISVNKNGHLKYRMSFVFIISVSIFLRTTTTMLQEKDRRLLKISTAAAFRSM